EGSRTRRCEKNTVVNRSLGACRAPRIRGRNPSARGRKRSPGGAARRWPWWRLHGVWPGRCSRCGETRPTINRDVFEPGARSPWRTRPRKPAAPPRCKFSEVVKLEEQARIDVWPHVRAILKRALLLLSNPPVRRHMLCHEERE